MHSIITNAQDRETLLRSEIVELAREDAMTGNFAYWDNFRKTILGGYYMILGDTSLLSLYALYETTFERVLNEGIDAIQWEPDTGFTIPSNS